MTKTTSYLFTIMGFLPFICLWSYPPYPSWASESVAVILIAIITATTFYSKKKLKIYPASPFLLIFPSLILIITAGLFYNRVSYNSVALTTILYLVQGIMISMTVLLYHKEKSEVLVALSKGLVFGAFLQIIFLIFQLLGWVDLYSQWVHKLPLLIPHFPKVEQPTGLLFQRNLLADYLIVAFVAGAYLRAKNVLKPWLLIILLPFLSFSIAATSSRTVFLYLIAIFGFCLIKRSKDIALKKFKFWVILLTLTTVIAIPSYHKLLGEKSSAISRFEPQNMLGFLGHRSLLWNFGATIFMENPLLGIGTGYYQGEYARLQGEMDFHPFFADYGSSFTHAHNLFLHLLAENGIFAGLIVLLFLGFYIFVFLRRPVTLEAFFALIALLTIFIHSQLEHPLWFSYFFFLFVIFFSSLIEPKKKIKGRQFSTIMIIFSLVIIGGTGLCTYEFSKFVDIVYNRQAGPASDEDRETLLQLSKNPFLNTKADIILMSKGIVDLSDQNLESKLAFTKEITRVRSSSFTLFRRAIYLAYNNQADEALVLIRRAYHIEPVSAYKMAHWYNKLKRDKRLFPLAKRIQIYLNQETERRTKEDKEKKEREQSQKK